MYSDEVRRRLEAPVHAGVIEDPTTIGLAGVPGAGNYVKLYLKVQDGLIRECRFQTYGCPAAIASSSMLAELATHKTPAEAGRIRAEEIISALGGLPLGKEHCAHLAVAALRQALSQLERGEEARSP